MPDGLAVASAIMAKSKSKSSKRRRAQAARAKSAGAAKHVEEWLDDGGEDEDDELAALLTIAIEHAWRMDDDDYGVLVASQEAESPEVTRLASSIAGNALPLLVAEVRDERNAGPRLCNTDGDPLCVVSAHLGVDDPAATARGLASHADVEEDDGAFVWWGRPLDPLEHARGGLDECPRGGMTDAVMPSHQNVRTTLDLDEDAVSAARELAGAERGSLGSVISELARRGLTPRGSRPREICRWPGCRPARPRPPRRWWRALDHRGADRREA